MSRKCVVEGYDGICSDRDYIRLFEVTLVGVFFLCTDQADNAHS